MSWRGKIGFLLILILLVLLVGGVIYLAFFDIPAPTTHVEKVLPDDRFPK